MESATNLLQQGLQFGKVYEDTKSLRYGRLMIMTDQDQDGSHIKGLIINFIHHFWPSLLKVGVCVCVKTNPYQTPQRIVESCVNSTPFPTHPQISGFLVEFVTPIVKATKGKQQESFFTLPEYEEWCEANNGAKSWKIKYYKGLGTSTPQEAKEYFAKMDQHMIPFSYSGPEDDLYINMVFSKKKVEERKQWLRDFKAGTFLDHATDQFVLGRGGRGGVHCVSSSLSCVLRLPVIFPTPTTRINYTDFVNKELILFSMSDNERSIPSMVDGFKPGQRKVFFSCLKRKLKDEIKVAQLAGYVSEHSSYHHGEVCIIFFSLGLLCGHPVLQHPALFINHRLAWP